MQSLEKELDDTKKSVIDYEKTMKTEIMQLNNDIGGLQQKFEHIEDQKNKLKSEAEEISSKKLNKVSDLARILMAIDNLENRCLNRKEKSGLKYPI
jgi:predicted  nucleic acid-binding Zn-ribbon protein